MKPEDTALVLAKCAAYDQRTIGQSDVAAWHEIIGHLQRADALEAVRRWYASHRERIYPSDVIETVRLLGNARATAILAAPAEHDPVRHQQVMAAVHEMAAKWGAPIDLPPDTPHGRALTRARRERGNRPIPASQTIRKRMPKLDLKPDDEPEVRERRAIAALHEAGRPCGRKACQCATHIPATERNPTP